MIKKNLRKLFLFAFLIVISIGTLSGSAEATVTWHMEQAATGRQYPTGFGYDADGNPAFVQMDYGATRVIYRYKSSSGWVSEIVGDASHGPSLAFSANGQPSVVYLNYSNNTYELIYAKRIAANNWQKITIESVPRSKGYIEGVYSLAFSNSGNPAVSYVRTLSSPSYDPRLYYAAYDGSSWKKSSVYSVNDVFYSDLTFNGSTPAIAFSAGKEGLKYAFFSSGFWRIQTVDSLSSDYFRNRQSDITLAFGNGRPLISYNDNDTRSLKFAYFLNNRWVTSTVEGSTSSTNYTADYATMQVLQRNNSFDIYIIHSNYVTNKNTSIKLKKLTVNRDSDLTGLGFTSETLYTKNFSNVPPLMVSSVKGDNPSLVFLDYWASKTYYMSMQPDIQAVSSVSFGAVTPQESATRDITITNIGSINLSINEINSPSAPFRITGGTFNLLAPGASRVITVYFEPSEAGVAYQDVLTIKSNDPDEGVFNISLSGRSVGNSADLVSVDFNNGTRLEMESTLTEYSSTVSFATNSIRVKSTAADSYAQIRVNGSVVQSGIESVAIPLSIGLNTITVHVTSEDTKTQKTYSLNITRKDSPDASLSGLTVSSGELSPAFSPEIFSYSLTLPNGITDLSFAATATQSGSIISINGHPFFEEFLRAEVGSNTFTIRVLAPDNESSMDYVITVYRLPELTGISLNNGPLFEDFNPYHFSYSAVVPNNVLSIRVSPTADSDCLIIVNNSAVENGGESAAIELETGDNLITLEVSSEDGHTQRIYTITVKRLEGLIALSLGNTPVLFSGNHFELDVQISEASSPLMFLAPDGMNVDIGVPAPDGISPPFSFNEGKNEPITILLNSPEYEVTAVYTLTVFRLPLLTSLEIADTPITLGADDQLVVWNVANTIDHVKLQATASTGTDIYLTGNLSTEWKGNYWDISNIPVGSIPLLLILTSQDGQVSNSYTIVIYRLPGLSYLSVSDGTLNPDFDVDIYNYTVTVDKDTSSISLTASASEDGSVLSIADEAVHNDVSSSPINLLFGSNIIPVVVETYSGYANSIYYVNVIRQGFSGSISPVFNTFDININYSADVNVIITWNDAGSIIDIKADGVSIGAASYSLSDINGFTATLTIKKEYLGMQSTGILDLTVEFDEGEPAILSIDITETPASSYTITFSSNGSVYTTKTVNSGESIGSAAWPINPSRNSYSFEGWFTGIGGTGAEFTPATPVNATTTVYAKWAYIGSDNNGSPLIAPTLPAYTTDLKTDDGTQKTLPVVVDKDTGSASLYVDLTAFNTSRAVVTLPSIPFVDTYTVSIPIADLLASGDQGSLTVNTDNGSITIPFNMLPDSMGISGSRAEISISQGNKDTLPDEVRAAIGDKPLISLTLSIDGKQINWRNPDAPVTVSIPYAPTAEELAHHESIVIWYIDGAGNVVNIPNGHYDPVTGKVTFKTTHFSNYAVAYNKVTFGDVATDSWYNKAVNFIAARGITTGTGGGNYSPNAKLTRGEFIVLMMRTYGIAPDTNPTNNFTDVGNTYYTGYISAARDLGITSGVGNNLFAPNREITRQEMFTLLHNALKVIGKLPQGDSGKALENFADAQQIDPWAKEALSTFVVTGTVSGHGGILAPKSTTTRAEMAQVLYNLLMK